MHTEAMIALSALVAGIAIAGATASLRSAGGQRAQLYLMAIFALFAVIVSLPLVVAFARPLYVFWLPAMLPMVCVLPALIHLYAKARTGDEGTGLVRVRDGLLPLVGALITFGYWSLPAAAKAQLFVNGELPAGSFPAALVLLTFGVILLWCLASCAYLIATIKVLRVYRERLKAIHSNMEGYELRWIDGLLVLLVALWAASALSIISDNLGPGIVLPGETVFVLAAAVLLFLIAFALAPEPIEGESLPAMDGDAEPELKDKYARSALTADRAEQIAERIHAAMHKDQLYLDANLSLQKLSQHVRAPQNDVSQTLNEKLRTTFFDYVAHWRIQAAKPLIEAGEASILTIALEVGFNSRSTFYKAFKRETGLTPKAFQERCTNR